MKLFKEIQGILDDIRFHYKLNLYLSLTRKDFHDFVLIRDEAVPSHNYLIERSQILKAIDIRAKKRESSGPDPSFDRMQCIDQLLEEIRNKNTNDSPPDNERLLGSDLSIDRIHCVDFEEGLKAAGLVKSTKWNSFFNAQGTKTPGIIKYGISNFVIYIEPEDEVIKSIWVEFGYYTTRDEIRLVKKFFNELGTRFRIALLNRVDYKIVDLKDPNEVTEFLYNYYKNRIARYATG